MTMTQSRLGVHLLLPLLLVACALALGGLTSTGSREQEEDDEEEEEEAPTLSLADWPAKGAALRGKSAYATWCAGCHGDEGDGAGDAAALLDPTPRNFQGARFKFRSTGSGKLPTNEDLLHVVTCGLPGSSMPSFRLVPEPQRRDIVAFVLHLASFGLAKGEVAYLMDAEGLEFSEVIEERMSEVRDNVAKRLADREPLAVPPEPEVTPAALAKAKVRFQKECAHCHGATGIGDGPSAYALRDWRDAAIRPRDLTTGTFRAGSTSRDLFLRLKGGLDGTPMPAISGTGDDLWGLVHYMQSLIRPTWESGSRSGCRHAEESR